MATVDPERARGAEQRAHGPRLQKVYVAVVVAAFWGAILLYAACAHYIAVVTTLKATRQDAFPQLMPWSDSIANERSQSWTAGQLRNKSRGLHTSTVDQSEHNGPNVTTNVNAFEDSPGIVPSLDGDPASNISVATVTTISNLTVGDEPSIDVGATYIVFSDEFIFNGSSVNSTTIGATVGDDSLSATVIDDGAHLNTTTSATLVSSTEATVASEHSINIKYFNSSFSNNTICGVCNGSVTDATSADVIDGRQNNSSSNDSISNGFPPVPILETGKTMSVDGSTASGEIVTESPITHSKKTRRNLDAPLSTAARESPVDTMNGVPFKYSTTNVTSTDDAPGIDTSSDFNGVSENYSFYTTISAVAQTTSEEKSLSGVSNSSSNVVFFADSTKDPSKYSSNATNKDPSNIDVTSTTVNEFLNDSLNNATNTSMSFSPVTLPIIVNSNKVNLLNCSVSSNKSALPSNNDEVPSSKPAGPLLIDRTDASFSNSTSNITGDWISDEMPFTITALLNYYIKDSSAEDNTRASIVSTASESKLRLNVPDTKDITDAGNLFTGMDSTSADITHGTPSNDTTISSTVNIRSVDNDVNQINTSTPNATVSDNTNTDEVVTEGNIEITSADLINGAPFNYSSSKEAALSICGNVSYGAAEEVPLNYSTTNATRPQMSFAESTDTVASNTSTGEMPFSDSNVTASTEICGNPNNISDASNASTEVFSPSTNTAAASVNANCSNQKNISGAFSPTAEGISSSSGNITVFANIGCDNPNNISIALNTSTGRISSSNASVPVSVKTSSGHPENISDASNFSTEGISTSNGTVPVSPDIDYSDQKNISFAADTTSRSSSPRPESGVIVVPAEGSLPAQSRSHRPHPSRQHMDRLLWEMRAPPRQRLTHQQFQGFHF